MRTSTSVLALLGLAIVGTETTQASVQLSDLEELFMQDLEDMEFNATELADMDPVYNLKMLTAQISNVIEQEGVVFRKLIQDSLEVQRQQKPDIKQGHLTELIDEWSVIVLKLQHSIMDLSATSGKVTSTLTKVTKYLKSASDPTKPEKTRAKYESIILKRLHGIVQDLQEETNKLQSSEALKGLVQFTKKVKASKFKGSMVKLENDIAQALQQKEEANEKLDETNERIQMIKNSLRKQKPNKVDRSLMDAACRNTEDEDETTQFINIFTIDCNDSCQPDNTKSCYDQCIKNIPFWKRWTSKLIKHNSSEKNPGQNKCDIERKAYKKAMKDAKTQYENAKERHNIQQTHAQETLENLNTQLKKLDMKIRNLKAQNEKIAGQNKKDKKAFDQIQGQFLTLAKEMHDLKSLVRYSEATEEVMNDIQNFQQDNHPSDKIDVSSDEYKKIQQYGQDTADMNDAAYFNEIKDSFGRAATQFDCGRQIVDQMVAKAAGHQVKKLDIKCKGK